MNRGTSCTFMLLCYVSEIYYMSPTLYMLHYIAMNPYLEVEFSVQHKPCGTIPHNHHIVSCCRGILAFCRCRTLLFPGMETVQYGRTGAHLCECGKGVSFCLVKHLAKCCRIFSNSISSKLSPLAAWKAYVIPYTP